MVCRRAARWAVGSKSARRALGTAPFFSPPPCGEGLGVGVVECGTAVPHLQTPRPDPPPQGGREQKRRAICDCRAVIHEDRSPAKMACRSRGLDRNCGCWSCRYRSGCGTVPELRVPQLDVIGIVLYTFPMPMVGCLAVARPETFSRIACCKRRAASRPRRSSGFCRTKPKSIIESMIWFYITSLFRRNPGKAAFGGEAGRASGAGNRIGVTRRRPSAAVVTRPAAGRTAPLVDRIQETIERARRPRSRRTAPLADRIHDPLHRRELDLPTENVPLACGHRSLPSKCSLFHCLTFGVHSRITADAACADRLIRILETPCQDMVFCKTNPPRWPRPSFLQNKATATALTLIFAKQSHR